MQTILSYNWGRQIQVYCTANVYFMIRVDLDTLILKLYSITCKIYDVLLSFYRLIIYFTFTENRFIVTMCLTSP